MRSTVRRAALLTVVLAGCYLSHDLGADGGARDSGGAHDSGPHDAGPHDAGRDFGPPPPLDLGADAACARPTLDPAFVDLDCRTIGMCPATGYSCVEVHGAALEMRCEIPCGSDCDCPATTTCEPFTDKSGTRFFCSAPPIFI